ncbi:hypothetical protein JBO49_23250 [Serratia fonticola]|uniref:hypothetical protein n=1 Tax=Serratia fonticola TaxID=47917 RepID=UPI00192BC5A9|nr:hypothetical protein [Serratia fonticola]MBL5863523.1 hypothetical protein [Serratia fonticola]
MKKKLVLFNNNLPNKYDYSFSTDSLVRQFLQHCDWDSGIPNFINHDMLRPLSWSRTHGVSIDNTSVNLFGELSIPENKFERKQINKLTTDYLGKTIYNLGDEDREKLANLIGKSLISEETKFIRGECVTAFGKNIAREKFPELFGNYENDKRNLVDLKKLDFIAPGVFLYNDILVFAHRYFRRSLSPLNNLNIPLLKILQELAEDENLSVKILLDPHSLGLPNSYLEPIELDYWWGPKFDDSLDKIPYGVTTHTSSKEEAFFSGISKTEFWWHEQNSIKSLECEETRDIPSGEMLELGNKYGFRYAHSMLNDKGIPYHLDGAIRLYDEDAFISRLDKTIDKAGKNSHYFKIWRIDGEITVPLWKRILSDYFKDNRLIGEYFDGKDIKTETFLSKKNEYLSKEKRYVYTPNKEQGVSIYLSAQKKENHPHAEVIINNEDLITDKFEIHNTMDVKFIGLKKKINLRFRESVDEPRKINFIAYEDMNLRIPEVSFHGENAIAHSLEYLRDVENIITNDLSLVDDSVITFTISIDYETLTLRISCVSYKQDFLKLISSKEFIPKEQNQLCKWVSDTYALIKDKNQNTQTQETLFLRNKRIYLPLIMLSEHEIEIDGNIIRIKFHESNIDNKKGMEKNHKAVMLNLVKKITCTKCNTSFFECECISGYKKIDDFSHLGAYWSDTNSFSEEKLRALALNGDKVAVEMANGGKSMANSDNLCQ